MEAKVMADLELYIDAMGFVYIGGKSIYFEGQEPLHAGMAEESFMEKYPGRLRMFAPEWIRLMRLWNEIRHVTRGAIFNVMATKETRHKEGYVIVAIIVDVAGKPKARLRWGADRPSTGEEVHRDLMALRQLIQFDLRLPAVLEEFYGLGFGRANFYLGAVVRDQGEARIFTAYMNDILERNFPHVFKSLLVAQ